MGYTREKTCSFDGCASRKKELDTAAKKVEYVLAKHQLDMNLEKIFKIMNGFDKKDYKPPLIETLQKPVSNATFRYFLAV